MTVWAEDNKVHFGASPPRYLSSIEKYGAHNNI